MNNGIDINSLAQAIIQAMNNNRSAQLQTIDQTRRMYNSQINNAANASGLLYSTKPAFQQMQYLGGTYLPSFTKINTSTEESIINTNNSLQKALDNIKSLNDAANQLAGI